MDASRLKPEWLQVRRLSALAGRRNAAPPRLLDELSLEKELDCMPTETLGHLGEIAEWDMDEVAMLIKAAFQNDNVPVVIHALVKPLYGLSVYSHHLGFPEASCQDPDSTERQESIHSFPDILFAPILEQSKIGITMK